MFSMLPNVGLNDGHTNRLISKTATTSFRQLRVKVKSSSVGKEWEAEKRTMNSSNSRISMTVGPLLVLRWLLSPFVLPICCVVQSGR